MLHNRIYERLSFNNFKKKNVIKFFYKMYFTRPVSTNKTFQEIEFGRM